MIHDRKIPPLKNSADVREMNEMADQLLKRYPSATPTMRETLKRLSQINADILKL